MNVLLRSVSPHVTTSISGPCVAEAAMLHVQGPLHASQGAEVRAAVQGLLTRGERTILVSLISVPKADAAGIGELVRAYNLATAMSGTLRIVHPSGRVRDLMRRVGLMDILAPEP